MGSPARQLIVNADDLGRTPGINAGIFRAHDRGLVTSATMMVGFPAAIEAADQAADYPELGIGLHVTLTGAEPLLPASLIPTLVDGNGRFPAKPEGHGELEAKEVLVEIEAQVARFEELTGRRPTHLDSHHHSHRLPVVCDVLAEVAARLDVPVRRASGDVADRLAAAGVRTTDVFVEEFFGEAATFEVLEGILGALRPGLTELMCHPAMIDETLRQGSSYVDERAIELAVLTDSRLGRILTENEIELAHFGRLPRKDAEPA